jgi:recombination protein RecR
MIQAIDELVSALSRLPTIGAKSAQRLVFHMLESPQEELNTLSSRIRDLRTRIVTCRQCFNYSEGELCPICSSTTRDQSLICVVEKPSDVFAMEKPGRYRGVYHILGGVLSPINGITADKLRIAQLRVRIETQAVKELIIGLGSSAEAETTSLYLARLFSRAGLRLTRLARGLPAGAELEYVDPVTLNQALNERIDIRYSDAAE